MLTKIKDVFIGFIGGLVCVIAFILGKKLHDNGNGIKQARDKLEDAAGGIDSVSDRIERSQETVRDSLDIIEKVRSRK